MALYPKLLFNLGEFEGGGKCIIVETDGEVDYMNSNDLINDLDAYALTND